MSTRRALQRIQAASGAPGQVAAQVGLGVDAGLALVTGQVGRDRHIQIRAERRSVKASPVIPPPPPHSSRRSPPHSRRQIRALAFVRASGLRDSLRVRRHRDWSTGVGQDGDVDRVERRTGQGPRGPCSRRRRRGRLGISVPRSRSALRASSCLVRRSPEGRHETLLVAEVIESAAHLDDVLAALGSDDHLLVRLDAHWKHCASASSRASLPAGSALRTCWTRHQRFRSHWSGWTECTPSSTARTRPCLRSSIRSARPVPTCSRSASPMIPGLSQMRFAHPGKTDQRYERASLWCLVELEAGVQHLTRTSSTRRGDLL